MNFDAETQLEPNGDGTFRADLDSAWSVVRGPNGGYLAAIVLNAMTAVVDDPDRAPRSLTIHYVAPAATAPLEVSVVVERSGRSMTTMSSRLVQEGKVIALALGAFSSERPGPTLDDAVMPVVPDPETVASMPVVAEAPPIARRWETRRVIGPAIFEGAPKADRAEVGAWMRLPEGHVPDAAVVAAATDGFVPAVFARVNEPMVVPTVDLTIHFRHRLPLEGATAHDWLLARFTTQVVSEGFLEEDGEVWSGDGRLLAQSRQLAVAFPFELPGSAG